MRLGKQLGSIVGSGVVFLTTGLAGAHPGHGETDAAAPAHYVVEPVHSLPVLILVGALAVVWLCSRAVRLRR